VVGVVEQSIARLRLNAEALMPGSTVSIVPGKSCADPIFSMVAAVEETLVVVEAFVVGPPLPLLPFNQFSSRRKMEPLLRATRSRRWVKGLSSTHKSGTSCMRGDGARDGRGGCGASSE
jgi:hypothetical protein